MRTRVIFAFGRSAAASNGFARPSAGAAASARRKFRRFMPETLIYDRALRQMPRAENVTPLAAAVTAVSTLLCCVPSAFAAALATTSVGLFVADHQGWLLAASVILIAVGAVQVRRAGRVCSVARRRTSATLLAISAAIVVMT